MALTPNQQAFADTLVQLSGLSPAAVYPWVQEENGPDNNILGVMPNGHLAAYPTPQAGAQATWAVLQAPMYAGIRNSAGQSAQAQLAAIVNSPWNTGKANDPNAYAGTGFRTLALGGATAAAIPGATVQANGVVEIPGNQATTGCWIPMPSVLGLSGKCLISDATGRKLGGGAAMGAGAVILIVGLWMIVGGSVPALPSVRSLAGRGRPGAGTGTARSEETEEEAEQRRAFEEEEQRSGRFENPSGTAAERSAERERVRLANRLDRERAA